MNEIVQGYSKENYKEIQGWMSKRGLSLCPPEFLPTHGAFIPGVCVGFLYQTDSKVCYLENLISNPDCNEVLTDAGLDLVVLELLEAAKELGFEVVVSITKLKSVVDRAEEHGFIVKDSQTLLIKPLYEK